MDSLAEQTDLRNLLYQEEGQPGLPLELQVREELTEAAPRDFPTPQQQERESVDQVYMINNTIQTHSCCAHRFRTNIVEH